MKKRLVTLIGIAVLTIALSSSPSASAGLTVQKISGDEYSISSEFVDFLYTGGITLCIKNEDVVEPRRQVFDEIKIDSFMPTGEPVVDASGLKLTSEGQYASATVHNNPTTTISFETHVQNIATFDFSTDIGAINRGSSLYIGNDEMVAEIILMGDGNISKNVFDQYVFDMEVNSSVILRNNFIDLEPIGEKIADEVIAGELFISQDQNSVIEDLVDYIPVSMGTTFSSKDELHVELSGEADEGKIFIFDISKDVLTWSKDDFTVKLDGATIESAPRDDVFETSGNEPMFSVLENEDYFQVYLYTPSLSTHTVVFAKLYPSTPLYGEILLGLGIATAISVVSAVVLFRSKKEN